jgi:hypothetical protein
MKYLEVFGQHTFRYAAEFLDGSVTITSRDDTDSSYSFGVTSTGIITDITSNTDVNWLRLFSTQGDGVNDEYKCSFIELSKTATDVDNQREGAIFFGGSSVGSNIASIVGYHHDVSDSEGAIQLSVRSEAYSGTSSIIADYYGNNPPPTPGNVIKGYGNGAGIVNVDLGYGGASTTTIAGGISIGGHAVNDIDIAGEFVDSDEHLMTSAAIDDRINAAVSGTFVDLTSEVSGVLPVANGGTGASSLTDNKLLTGTGTSAVTAEANATYDGENLSIVSGTDSVGPELTLENQHSPASGVSWPGPKINLFNQRSADGGTVSLAEDGAGLINFQNKNGRGAGAGGPETINYARIYGEVVLNTDGAENGKLQLDVMTNGTEASNFIESYGSSLGLVNTFGDGGLFTTFDFNGALFTVNSIFPTGPAVKFSNNVDDASGPHVYIENLRGGTGGSKTDGSDGDDCGTIIFRAYDDGTPTATSFASIFAEAIDVSDGSEKGRLELKVAEYDATLTTGLKLDGTETDGEIDVTIAAGADSLTTVAGDVQVNGGGISCINSTNSTLSLATSHASNVPYFSFQRTATGTSGDDLGIISFVGDDDGGGFHTYGKILGEIADATAGAEAGRLSLQVAEFDGTVTTGILVNGDTNADGEVDVTIGAGADSLTTIVGDMQVSGGTINFTSAESSNPVFNITNSHTDGVGSQLNFKKTATGADGDDLGNIIFIGDDDGDSSTVFSRIKSEIETAADTDEAGKLSLDVRCSDGSTSAEQQGLVATGHGTNNTVNIGLGYGTASTTTVAGNLNANGTDHAFTSSTDNKPNVTLSCGGTSQGGAMLTFLRTATGADNQNLGDIFFKGKNDADEDITYAYINADLSDASDGVEEGSLSLFVRTQGVSRTGFYCVGNGASVVDTQIGTGATSVATIAGGISIGGHTVNDIDVAGEFVDSDEHLMTSAAIDDRINAAAGGVTADPFSTTIIKILPHQFMINDDAGRPAMIEDDTSNTLGVRCAHTIDEMYAFQKIPTGYKVTHVQVHASASTSSAVTARSFNYQTGADNNVSETSGDLNSNIDITDIPASATQDLVIKVAPASASTIIYGATVTIATI